ncbi:dethiobiotin synthase [Pseudoalteromonas denitrificans]|uniref:ATP-dependent dethiobiotin synthetase BioD n=1 Tax=Pseudoalteromonas denitrificans DSM 6059 TaxID=1123010 RepID=A0A1I1SQF0_9GAMM|nr:dethiobiotin synthase [Pseudoalteromonas denitrificans]SFD46948.1 dethiobiotin synthetase [Pseudoalteromonas denitrificans DSM 6059]
MNEIFITGTDTEVGKTFISSLLIKYIKQHKKKVLGFKPIAAGAEYAFGELVNDDALTLLESGNVSVPYNIINPYIFEQAIAPHIAAQESKKCITLGGLNASYKSIKTRLDPEGYLITEGAGGWALPINEEDYLYDWVKAQNLNVILVVGLKLGCLNHALLTHAHMKSIGVNCIGWIANHIDPSMHAQQQNIDSLIARLPMPLLAVAPFYNDSESEKPKLQVYKVLSDVLNLK